MVADLSLFQAGRDCLALWDSGPLFRAWEEKDFYIHCDVIVSTGDGDLQERESVSLDPQWVLPLAKLALAMR